ncbi:MAG: aminotransferase class IV [Bacteroidetes bacterium]|nr:aminotransferase class IV [Bacteroidota bacterium]
MKPFCFADGKIIPTQDARLHPTDLAVIRGYGIFDFFRTEDYQPLFLEDYLDRFIRSAAKTYLPLDYSREELRAIIGELIQKNDLEKGGIRMVLTGGISENHFSPATGKLFIFGEELSFPAEEKYQNGIKLLSMEHVRAIADIKTTNYTLPVWHSMQWKAQGAEDVLYHWDGQVSESSRSNFFIVKDGIIHTPNQHILLGITRKNLLDLARNVQVRPITLEEVWEADEAFISATTKIILPVTQIDDRKVGSGKVGKVSQDILEKFQGKVQAYLRANKG